MTLRKGFDPHLAIDDVTITARDIDMLRAIDRYGSMHKAAAELGRSYPHLQRRVVELEDAIGPLTRRVRGGKGGGGTELTADTLELIRQFERLRVELSGVTNVPEAVISGTVTEQNGGLATVRTAAGEITARVPKTAADVEIAVRADAVVLMNPRSPSHARTSLRNQLPGVVSALEIDESIVTVTVEIATGVTLKSIVTAESVARLDIEPGSDVVAAFKSTAARAVATDQR